MPSGIDLPCFRRCRGRSSAKQQRWSQMISPSCGELYVLAMRGLQGGHSGLHHNLRAVPTERLNMSFNPAQSKAFCKDVINHPSPTGSVEYLRSQSPRFPTFSSKTSWPPRNPNAYIYAEKLDIMQSQSGQIVSHRRTCHNKCQYEHQRFSVLRKISPIVHRNVDHRCSEGNGSFDDSNTHSIVASWTQKITRTECQNAHLCALPNWKAPKGWHLFESKKLSCQGNWMIVTAVNPLQPRFLSPN